MSSATHDETERWHALQRAAPEWFRKSKLGFFIHWGAYSVPAWAQPTGELGTLPPTYWFRHNPYSEWYSNTIRLSDSPAARRHLEIYGDRAYESFLDDWQAESFDPEALIGELAAAGGQYVVLTTKHHDGICLWDAPGSKNFNTVARGPRRDLVGPLADATCEAGMRFGVYYSGGLDWHARPSPPHGLKDTFELDDRPVDSEYAAYAAGHIRDLIRRYAPDLLWNDIEWPDAGKNFSADGIGTVFEEFYASRPDGVVNDRWNVPHADYRTSEYQHFREHESGMWENCRGVGLSFAYNQVEDSYHALSGPGAIRYLVDIVSRGGRLLLGVGPMADGTLPGWQSRILGDIGQWTRQAADWLTDAVPSPQHEPEDATTRWLRWCRHGEDTLVFVDHLGERGAEATDVVLDQVSAAKSLVPEWAQVTQSDSGVVVRLEADRPGPAILRVST